MDRHAATRRLKHLAATAGVRMPRMHPHMLRHTFVTTMGLAPHYGEQRRLPRVHVAVVVRLDLQFYPAIGKSRQVGGYPP
jgi:integrase